MGIRHKREQMFLDTIADKNKTYTYQPRWFYFADGSKYMPDFYCKEDDTYIEVVGTRQAYHLNKHKYKKMAEEFPTIKFQIVKFDKVKRVRTFSEKYFNHTNQSKMYIWLQAHKMTLIEFEKLSGVPYQRISGHIRNNTPLSEENTLKVLRATQNEVEIGSLRPKLKELICSLT